jgi:hypothetical protein
MAMQRPVTMMMKSSRRCKLQYLKQQNLSTRHAPLNHSNKHTGFPYAIPNCVTFSFVTCSIVFSTPVTLIVHTHWQVCAAIDDIDRVQHHELEAIDRLIRVQAGAASLLLLTNIPFTFVDERDCNWFSQLFAGHEVGTRGGAVSVGVAEQIHHVKQRWTHTHAMRMICFNFCRCFRF